MSALECLPREDLEEWERDDDRDEREVCEDRDPDSRTDSSDVSLPVSSMMSGTSSSIRIWNLYIFIL